MTRRWSLLLPAPCEWLTANQRLHWAQRSRRTKAWRQTAHLMARSEHLPRGLKRAHITAHLRFTDRRRRDPGNWYPTVKACIDGLVTDHGLLPDDDAAHLIGPDIRLGNPIERRAGVAAGALLLYIAEAAEPSLASLHAGEETA